MVTDPKLAERLDLIRALRGMGASLVRIGDLTVSFGPTALELEGPKALTDEERQKREDEILFHSAGGA